MPLNEQGPPSRDVTAYRSLLLSITALYIIYIYDCSFKVRQRRRKGNGYADLAEIIT